MPHTNKRKISISILIPFAVVALVFGGLIWKKMHDSREPRPIPQINEPAASRKGVLFFVVNGTHLAREARDLESCGGTEECLKDLLDELVSGPVGDLDEALPASALVNSVRLEGNLAIVDMNQAFVSDMPAGSSAEVLAVYSLVNTVCVNYPAVTSVKITVEGAVASGMKHLDLNEPLSPDYSLEQPAGASAQEPAVPAARKEKP